THRHRHKQTHTHTHRHICITDNKLFWSLRSWHLRYVNGVDNNTHAHIHIHTHIHVHRHTHTHTSQRYKSPTAIPLVIEPLFSHNSIFHLFSTAIFIICR